PLACHASALPAELYPRIPEHYLQTPVFSHRFLPVLFSDVGEETRLCTSFFSCASRAKKNVNALQKRPCVQTTTRCFTREFCAAPMRLRRSAPLQSMPSPAYRQSVRRA